MTAIGRAFVAVAPPPEVLDAIGERVGAVEPRVRTLRWSRVSHLTLQFLGAVADLAPLESALRAAVSAVPRFRVRLGGAGAFPKPARGNVVWLGVVDGAGGLGALAAAVTEATAALGYPVEDRPYRPHLTLARAPRPQDVRPVVSALGDEPVGPAWTVEAAVLFESHTRPEGAVHTERARLPLGA